MRRWIAGIALCSWALSCAAGQGPAPETPSPGANPSSDGTILPELLKRFREKPVITPNGVGNVQPGQARLCEVCGQPLYKHGDPGFECVPLGKHMPKIETTTVQCPVCQAQFSGALPGNINARGGQDRDFCVHSIDKFSVHSNVWMCPDCGYAALIPTQKERKQKEGPPVALSGAPLGKCFLLGLDGKPVDDATKEFSRQKLFAATRALLIRQAALKEENPEPKLLQFSEYVLQTQIPDWVKYDHALQLYERLKPPHTLMAKLYLEAAHACRREVCSEISAPYLDDMLLESLGKSISRINRYLRAECLALRRARGDPVIDPTRPETDPRLLTQAAARIIQIGDEAVAQRRAIVAGAEQVYFTNADMFVLHLTHAGALDRLGKMDEAGKELAKALSYIPERPAVPLEDKTLEDRIVRQLKLLRAIVEDRQTCLQLEKDYLFKAARQNMSAIRLNEIKFRECKRFDPQDTGTKEWDAAPTSYLLGELLRRAGCPDEAAAWFAAAGQIAEKNLEVVDAAEKASPPAEPTPVVVPGKEAPVSPFVRQRGRLLDLQLWIQEQIGLTKATKEPDPTVKAAVEQVLQAAGIALGAGAATPRILPPEVPRTRPEAAQKAEKGPITPPEAAVKPAKEPAVPPGTGTIKTREQLYKMYFAAITRYRNDKKENPPTLAELVKAGYVKEEDSNLDANGKLLCPETKERLGYMRNWEPGDKTAEVLFTIKPGSKALYADGEVRERPGTR